MHQIVHEMSFKSVVNVLNSNPKNILRCLYNVSRVSKTAAAVNFFFVKKIDIFPSKCNKLICNRGAQAFMLLGFGLIITKFNLSQ